MKPATGPMPADQPKFGLGKTTPREMAAVMERIGRCELAGPGELGGARMRARDDGGLRGGAEDAAQPVLPGDDSAVSGDAGLDGDGVGIASKTGSLNAVRTMWRLWRGRAGRWCISIFTYDNADQGWTVDNEGEVTIAKLAKAIVEAWSPEGLDGKTLVPGLGLVLDSGSRGSNVDAECWRTCVESDGREYGDDGTRG